MTKKQWVVAIVVLLLIPVVLMLGGTLFSLINPEIAAGHPNYVRNFHLLSLLKRMILWVSIAAVAGVKLCILGFGFFSDGKLWIRCGNRDESRIHFANQHDV